MELPWPGGSVSLPSQHLLIQVGCEPLRDAGGEGLLRTDFHSKDTVLTAGWTCIETKMPAVRALGRRHNTPSLQGMVVLVGVTASQVMGSGAHPLSCKASRRTCP